jgi:hypothetical protein
MRTSCPILSGVQQTLSSGLTGAISFRQFAARRVLQAAMSESVQPRQVTR